MTLLANPHEVSFRFGDYIEEFQAILATNNINYGSPDNFSTFARRLYSDDLLSADLDRMVRSVILRESGNVSLRTILTIIAIATGGEALAKPDRDLTKPMQLVIDAMITSGGYSTDDPNHLDDLCRSTIPEDTPTFIPESSPFPHPDNSAADLNQSLTRLERNAVEAKQYLDSIEQRISRIEPLLETIPFTEPPEAPPNLAPIAPEFEPPTTPDELPVTTYYAKSFTDEPKKRFTQLLFSYRVSHGFVQRVAVVPLFLAAAVGGTLLYRTMKHHPTAQTPNTPIATAFTPQLTVIANQQDHPNTKPHPKKLSPYSTPTAVPTPNHSHQHIEPSPTAAEATTLNDSVEPENPNPTPASSPAPAKILRNVKYTFANIPSTLKPTRTIDISSGVMAPNLLSAPPPSYPKLASLTHMQGKVVMQAIIAKNGTVQNLQVLQGHRLLRNAAKKAVRSWRYRPHLINDKPVEVATIVTVDFNLQN
ncbi:MAG TPA: TonB family protein [Edaphobacter sp.]